MMGISKLFEGSVTPVPRQSAESSCLGPYILAVSVKFQRIEHFLYCEQGKQIHLYFYKRTYYCFSEIKEAVLCMLGRFSSFRLFASLWTVACQAPLSMRFSRQEYWSGLPCPPPGDLPTPGIKPVSPVLQADTGTFRPLLTQPPGKPIKEAATGAETE